MADWTQDEAEVPGNTTHLWEESWDDDDTSEDFSAQLKYAYPTHPYHSSIVDFERLGSHHQESSSARDAPSIWGGNRQHAHHIHRLAGMAVINMALASPQIRCTETGGSEPQTIDRTRLTREHS